MSPRAGAKRESLHYMETLESHCFVSGQSVVALNWWRIPGVLCPHGFRTATD
jgi:hypothetical protein